MIECVAANGRTVLACDADSRRLRNGVGDICERAIGEGVAATRVLLAVLAAVRKRAAQLIALYWTTVAVARTAGTAIGDWLAENKLLYVGLTTSTLITGVLFVAVLTLWRSRTKEAGAVVDPLQVSSRRNPLLIRRSPENLVPEQRFSPRWKVWLSSRKGKQGLTDRSASMFQATCEFSWSTTMKR
jgi:hypothetical protein